MSFYSRKYHFYLLFADAAKGKEPWIKGEWGKIQPLFEKIIKHSSYYNKAGLGVLAYAPRPNSEYFDDIKFGKLRWNEKSFEKWTFEKDEKERKFCCLNCWTPMRTVCGKIDSAPDIYFSINNEECVYKKNEIEFDFLVVIAIAEELNYNGREDIIELSKVLNAKKTVYKYRRWDNVPDPENNAQWSFINSIQDTGSFGMYRAKTLKIHDTKFEDLKFEPYWTIIYSS